MIEKSEKILKEIFEYCPQWRGIASDKLAYLYETAKQCTHPIIEIGCGDGFYTIALAFGSRDGNKVKVVSIDPHTGLATVPIENPTDKTDFTDSAYIGELKPIYQEDILANADSYADLLKHIEEWNVKDIVQPILNYSELAFPELRNIEAELLLIDGDHRYHFVKNDFELYSQLVVKNGNIAFDDGTLAGVDAVITEIGNQREDFMIVNKGHFIIAQLR